MPEPLGVDVLARMARAGLLLPRSSVPGRTWQPRNPTEAHLLRQARALDLMRRQLLGEVNRLQASVRMLHGQNRLQQVRAAAARLEPAPGPGVEPPSKADLVERLSPEELETLVSGAMGETMQAFVDRMCLNQDTVKARRRRALQKLQADTFAQAVAIVVAAGKATGVFTGTGGAP
jgi:DNA-binding NarL/FixJ family response regulator